MDQPSLNPSSAISDSRFSNSSPVLDEDTIGERGVNPLFAARDVAPTHTVEDVSHPCGDHLILFATIEGEVILDIKHGGSCCCMTKALADILCERLVGRTTEALMLMSRNDVVNYPVARNREGCIRLPFELLKALYAKTKAVRPEGTGSKDSGSGD
jgi:NifU-like protein involved in Fe-S cluster formation